MTQLGVNIDHIATIRQARKTIEADPSNIRSRNSGIVPIYQDEGGC